MPGPLPAVRFAAMSPARYETYHESLVAEYAAEGARATGMPAAEAAAFAAKQIASILPDGPDTPGQHLHDLVLPSGETAGVVWFAEQLGHEPPRVFIYDLEIDEPRRGLGLGTAALTALEPEARELGAKELALHVFTHNRGAIRLYERLGYRLSRAGSGGQEMTKAI